MIPSTEIFFLFENIQANLVNIIGLFLSWAMVMFTNANDI